MQNMSCEREELLSRYIDGDLTAQESSEMRRHISSCRECQVSFHEIQQGEKAFKDVMLPVISSMSLRDTVMRRIAAEGILPESPESPSVTTGGPRRSLFLGYAVAFLFVIACGLVFYLNALQPNQEKEMLDMIVVMGLGDQSSYGRKVMRRGEACYAQFAVGMPMQGKLALFVNGQNIAPIVFDGSATLSLHKGSADWISGAGRIETSARPDFTLAIGSDRITLTDADLVVGGAAGSYTALLHRGSAVRIRNGVTESMQLVKRIATVTAETATHTAELASETASASFHELSPVRDTPAPDPVPTSSSLLPTTMHSISADQATPVELRQPVSNPFSGHPVKKLGGE